VVEPEGLDELLRAMASSHRRCILIETWGCERSAGELAERLGLAPASVSEHLKVLRKTGLVTMRAEGTHRLYHAHPGQLAHLIDLLSQTFPADPRTQPRSTPP
jgi:DNA-binding transcriptional ArsR family regulator